MDSEAIPSFQQIPRHPPAPMPCLSLPSAFFGGSCHLPTETPMTFTFRGMWGDTGAAGPGKGEAWGGGVMCLEGCRWKRNDLEPVSLRGAALRLNGKQILAPGSYTFSQSRGRETCV